jgi:hypothetical protein
MRRDNVAVGARTVRDLLEEILPFAADFVLQLLARLRHRRQASMIAFELNGAS